MQVKPVKSIETVNKSKILILYTIRAMPVGKRLRMVGFRFALDHWFSYCYKKAIHKNHPQQKNKTQTYSRIGVGAVRIILKMFSQRLYGSLLPLVEGEQIDVLG